MAHVAEWKEKYVDDLVGVIMENPVVGIINIHGIPVRQMQKMRENIRGLMVLKGSKNTLIKLALEKAAAQGKANIDSLSDYIEGQTAVVTSDLNPFKLYKQFEATKTPTPARGGEIAPEDILVKKGETPFKPGPIVSEFQRAGLPAAIEKGKIIIRKNTVIVKKGEEISKHIAGVLTKLEIFPLEVGLDLRGVWEEGNVFGASSLKVDEEQILSQLKLASLQAFNLAIFSGYTTRKTIVPLIQKAFTRALSFSVSTGFPTPDSVGLMFAKARGQMMALASLLDPEALDPGIQPILSSTRVAAPASSVSEEKKEGTSEAEEEGKKKSLKKKQSQV